MAVTFYGVNKTLYKAGNVNVIEPELQGGKVKCLVDEYTFVTTEADTDVIELGGLLLPAEARIVDWKLDHGDLGNARTLAFGTKASGAVFMAAANCGAGAAAKKNYEANGVAGSLGYEIISGNGQVPTLTLGGGAALAVKVIVAIYFVSKG